MNESELLQLLERGEDSRRQFKKDASNPDSIAAELARHRDVLDLRGRGFNTLGELEIPEAAIEELLVNALIHRDYFTSASIRIMVFSDRVEIISPGDLPDSLSVEAIRHGRTNRRNPTLTEHAAAHILPYRGMGSGISKMLICGLRSKVD
jgi:hypothetical protein